MYTKLFSRNRTIDVSALRRTYTKVELVPDAGCKIGTSFSYPGNNSKLRRMVNENNDCTMPPVFKDDIVIHRVPVFNNKKVVETAAHFARNSSSIMRTISTSP